MTEREYRGAGITIRYDASRCRHVEACVRSAPAVFDATRRPWIDPDGESEVEHVAAVVRMCPTGALHYTLTPGPDEVPDPVTTVTPIQDGPLLVRGDLRLDRDDGTVCAETRAALCRCGHSGNKPFCDGSHTRAGWTAAGQPGPAAH